MEKKRIKSILSLLIAALKKSFKFSQDQVFLLFAEQSSGLQRLLSKSDSASELVSEFYLNLDLHTTSIYKLSFTSDKEKEAFINLFDRLSVGLTNNSDSVRFSAKKFYKSILCHQGPRYQEICTEILQSLLMNGSNFNINFKEVIL